MQVIPKPWGPSLLLAALFCGWTPEYLSAQEGKAVGVEAQLRAVDFVGEHNYALVIGIDDYSDPTGPENGTERVMRGGSWCGSAHNCRAAIRYRYTADFRYYNLGFRVVCVSVPGL